jgi:hypothetical protein
MLYSIPMLDGRNVTNRVVRRLIYLVKVELDRYCTLSITAYYDRLGFARIKAKIIIAHLGFLRVSGFYPSREMGQNVPEVEAMLTVHSRIF